MRIGYVHIYKVISPVGSAITLVKHIMTVVRMCNSKLYEIAETLPVAGLHKVFKMSVLLLFE